MAAQVLEGSHALTCQCFVGVGSILADEHEAGAQFDIKENECVEVRQHTTCSTPLWTMCL